MNLITEIDPQMLSFICILCKTFISICIICWVVSDFRKIKWIISKKVVHRALMLLYRILFIEFKIGFYIRCNRNSRYNWVCQIKNDCGSDKLFLYILKSKNNLSSQVRHNFCIIEKSINIFPFKKSHHLFYVLIFSYYSQTRTTCLR